MHDALQDVMKEIAVMKKLNHPNVIRLHEVLYGEEKGKLYLSKKLNLFYHFIVFSNGFCCKRSID